QGSTSRGLRSAVVRWRCPPAKARDAFGSMKSALSILFAPTGFLASPAFGQTVIQLIGAADPEDKGFFRSEFGADVGPVLGDIGFDAWSFDASGGVGFYNYQLSSEQQQAAATQGWELSVRMRMVTSNSPPGTFFALGPL